MTDGIKLDLSGAKEVSFEPLPRGRYHVNVFEVTEKKTKGGGKMPEGTPMLNVQFIVDGDFHEDYNNRRLFKQYPIPPADYEKRDALNNNLFTFFKAIGYTDAQIKKWKLLPDLDDMAGRPCRLVVSQREYKGEVQNEVRQVLPAGEDEPTSALDEL